MSPFHFPAPVAGAAAAFACALGLGVLAGAPAEAGMVRTLCQVEVDEAEITPPAARPETVGFMKRVDGVVRVLRRTPEGVQEIEAEIGMDLYAQDAVTTGANGGFDAIFTDNSTLSGVADTCIEISAYAYRPAENTGNFRLRLGRGVVSVSAGEVAKIKGDTMSVKIRNDTNLAVTGTRIVIRAL